MFCGTFRTSNCREFVIVVILSLARIYLSRSGQARGEDVISTVEKQVRTCVSLPKGFLWPNGMWSEYKESLEMRMIRTFLPLLLGALMLTSGCVTTSGTTQDASQEWRLQSLEESFLDFQEAQRQEAARARAADEELGNRLARLEERVFAILNGGNELPPDRDVRQGAAQEMESNMDADSGVGSMEAPTSPPDRSMSPPEATSSLQMDAQPRMPEQLPAPIKAGPESDEEKPWANVPGPALEVTTRPSASRPASQPVMTASASGSAQELYDKGLNLVRSGRAEQGRNVLEQFLKQYPGNKLVPNAIYWTGESWYGQKDYPQAILSFKDVVTKYPKHSKAQAALLKIGMSYRNVGDKDNAVFYLRTLVDDHPGSEPAKMAEQLLREIPN